MAGIDKIYVNSVERFIEFRDWCEEISEDCFEKTRGFRILDYVRDEPLKEIEEWFEELRTSRIQRLREAERALKLPITDERYINVFGESWDTDSEGNRVNVEYSQFLIECYKKDIDLLNLTGEVEVSIPMSNFPMGIDRYLIQNCPIDWVHETLRDQYVTNYDAIKANVDIYSRPYIFEPATKVKILSSNLKRNYCGLSGSMRRGKKVRKSRLNWYIRDLTGPAEDDYWVYDEDGDRWINLSKECKPIYGWTCSSVDYGKSMKALVNKILRWKLPKEMRIVVQTPYVDEKMILITK